MKEVVIEVWGDFACFTMPQAKVERLTYPFPPPSAARGILSAIYMKPKEFLWRVHRIEVLEPIRYISFKRNEIKCTVSSTPVSAEEERTQRQTTALGNEFVKMIFVSFLNSNIYLLKKRLTSRVGIFLETPYSKASSHFPIASH